MGSLLETLIGASARLAKSHAQCLFLRMQGRRRLQGVSHGAEGSKVLCNRREGHGRRGIASRKICALLTKSQAGNPQMEVKIGKASSRLLDVLRGVAALLVVAGHSREYASTVFNLNATGATFIEKLLLVPSSFAMESVAVFFVLSGFLVGGQTLREVKDDTFSWKIFLVKRLSRLWTVLLPGILFTWAIWWWNKHWWGIQVNEPTLMSGIGNLLYLQEAWCESFSINASLWSLSYEFWFYIVFAGSSIAVVNRMRNRHGLFFIGVMVVLSVLALFGVKLLFLIPGWLMGVFVYWLSSKGGRLCDELKRRGYLYVALSILLISLFALISNLLGMERNGLTTFVALPTALFVLSALHVELEPKQLRKLVGFGAALGQWSFSIYVFHLPIVLTVLYALRGSGIAVGISLPILTYSVAIVSLPITLLIWYFTERFTPKIRSYALRLTHIKSS